MKLRRGKYFTPRCTCWLYCIAVVVVKIRTKTYCPSLWKVVEYAGGETTAQTSSQLVSEWVDIRLKTMSLPTTMTTGPERPRRLSKIDNRHNRISHTADTAARAGTDVVYQQQTVNPAAAAAPPPARPSCPLSEAAVE